MTSIKSHIPNTITCCNLLSGCIAILFAAGDAPGMAFLFIILGAVFDFFDGMSARLLGVSSPIGKELDSLADVVTFGVAPATIVYNFLYWQVSWLSWPSVGTAGVVLGTILTVIPYLAFLMAAFSALRLAKFNLDERQAMGFIGLPTPANALFWGALVVGIGSDIPATLLWLTVTLVGIFVSCWLLVSEVPMFALKFKTWGWAGNEIKYVFLLTCIPLLLVLGVSGLAAVIAWYVVLSVGSNCFKKK